MKITNKEDYGSCAIYFYGEMFPRATGDIVEFDPDLWRNPITEEYRHLQCVQLTVDNIKYKKEPIHGFIDNVKLSGNCLGYAFAGEFIVSVIWTAGKHDDIPEKMDLVSTGKLQWGKTKPEK